VSHSSNRKKTASVVCLIDTGCTTVTGLNELVRRYSSRMPLITEKQMCFLCYSLNEKHNRYAISSA
jgi:hypothetical protein